MVHFIRVFFQSVDFFGHLGEAKRLNQILHKFPQVECDHKDRLPIVTDRRRLRRLRKRPGVFYFEPDQGLLADTLVILSHENCLLSYRIAYIN